MKSVSMWVRLEAPHLAATPAAVLVQVPTLRGHMAILILSVYLNSITVHCSLSRYSGAIKVCRWVGGLH